MTFRQAIKNVVVDSPFELLARWADYAFAKTKIGFTTPKLLRSCAKQLALLQKESTGPSNLFLIYAQS